MILMGELSMNRMPWIRLNNNIRVVNELKYLGVILDSKTSFLRHLRYASSRCVNSLHGIVRAARQEWGIKTKIIYREVAEPILTYASPVWVGALDRDNAKNTLLRVQRKILLFMTKAYATVPTVALPVLVGVLPIDLLARLRADQ